MYAYAYLEICGEPLPEHDLNFFLIALVVIALFDGLVLREGGQDSRDHLGEREREQRQEKKYHPIKLGLSQH